MRELILDTETTGLDPKAGHRLIELACVEVINFIPTGVSWHWYFNPERDVPREATEIHGLTAAFLADKPKLADLAPDILAVIANTRLVIHNAAFDLGFLNHEFAALGHSVSFDNVVDTLALARRKHPGSPNNLDALCRRFEIDNSARTKHGALLDCELLADVYLKLMGAEQAGLNFAPRNQDRENNIHIVARARPQPLPSRILAEELDAHLRFVETLGPNALWRSFRAAESGIEETPVAQVAA